MFNHNAVAVIKNNYPTLSFYNELPDQFKGLEVIERKLPITNWEWIKETWFVGKGLVFDSFYQCSKTACLMENGKIWEGMPVGKSGDWPDVQIIPFDHVKIKRIPYYDVIYKLRYEGGEEFTAGSVSSELYALMPEILGYIVKKGFDDVAFYVGPLKPNEEGGDHE